MLLLWSGSFEFASCFKFVVFRRIRNKSLFRSVYQEYNSA